MKDSYNLIDKQSGQSETQLGFTLIEMLFVVIIISMIGLLAQPLIKIGFLQLSRLTHDNKTSTKELAETSQWLKNDILQWRGDKPWSWLGSLDAKSCLINWTFVTTNIQITENKKVALIKVNYLMQGKTLRRDVIYDDTIIYSHVLLRDVECLHPQFWQQNRWENAPLQKKKIKGFKMTIKWKGPSVEHIWPVNITYDTE